MNSIPYKNQILFLIYFGLSALITWFFVDGSPLYISEDQKIVSALIAGGKWGLQIFLAFVFLGKQKWLFIKNIGSVCFIGSCFLLPFIFLTQLNLTDDPNLFTGSLLAAVVAMIYYYSRAVRLSMVGQKWWYFWLFSLATAILLQLTIVFHVI